MVLRCSFYGEAEVKVANTFVAMRFLRERVTCHNAMYMSNSMQKVTTNANIFKNESVLAGWYQARLSKMIPKVVL